MYVSCPCNTPVLAVAASPLPGPSTTSSNTRAKPIPSGIGWIGYYKAAVGWTGWNSAHDGASETHAHEVGHNHGRQHAPGCSAANPDPNYPYTDGNGQSPIGNAGAPNYGFDVYGSQTIYPYTDYYDIMGYCDPVWISDYTYEAILTYAQQNNLMRLTQPEPVLLVSGILDENDTTATLRPALTFDTSPRPLETGPSAGTCRTKWRQCSTTFHRITTGALRKHVALECDRCRRRQPALHSALLTRQRQDVANACPTPLHTQPDQYRTTGRGCV